ncbi:transporter substrate-binding domain-containing protein [Vreelandella aquamarina]|uniref:transporter substrate-binding domain-containing protein n=1 Tax=Vreelandella aquamarina TaxID=77097 RepID=UPI001CC6E2E0|nr:transporter substrate-binding domain-containing protein [Halomonas aquamarina]
MLTLSGCRYPQDIEGSMERIDNGVMRVGVSENPPWVIEAADGPAGLEVELVQALADELGATIEWHWGGESHLLLALEQHQLDLVISGLTENARISQLAAPTNAYYQSDYRVGAPLGMTLPDTLEGQDITLSAVNHVARSLEKEGAVVHLTTPPLPDNQLVVQPTWWLMAHDYAMSHDTLATDAHIMALPKGENAWMMAVQRHLDSASDIEQRLKGWETDQ